MLPTEQLAELIHQKYQVLVRLHAIAVRQGELIGEGDMPPLLELLAAKQKLLGALASIESRLEPFQAEEPDARQWQTPEARAACSAEAAQCNRLLDETKRLELLHAEQMQQRRDAVSQQLHRAHAAHQARDAYQTHHRPNRSTAVPLVDSKAPVGGIDLSTGS